MRRLHSTSSASAFSSCYHFPLDRCYPGNTESNLYVVFIVDGLSSKANCRQSHLYHCANSNFTSPSSNFCLTILIFYATLFQHPCTSTNVTSSQRFQQLIEHQRRKIGIFLTIIMYYQLVYCKHLGVIVWNRRDQGSEPGDMDWTKETVSNRWIRRKS